MLYAILIMLFALLGFVRGMNRTDNRKGFHNSVRYNSKQRSISQPVRLAATRQQRREGRAARALKWN